MSDGQYQILYPDSKHKAEYVITLIKKIMTDFPNDADLGMKVRELISNMDKIQKVERETDN